MHATAMPATSDVLIVVLLHVMIESTSGIDS